MFRNHLTVFWRQLSFHELKSQLWASWRIWGAPAVLEEAQEARGRAVAEASQSWAKRSSQKRIRIWFFRPNFVSLRLLNTSKSFTCLKFYRYNRKDSEVSLPSQSHKHPASPQAAGLDFSWANLQMYFRHILGEPKGSFGFFFKMALVALSCC